MKTLNAVAANLKAIRGPLSQAVFAELLGIKSQVTYHRYENGRIPKTTLLQDMCSRFGITVDEFLSPLEINLVESIRDALTSQGSEQDFASENLPPAGVETLNAVAEAVSELVNQQSVASVKAALRIQDLQHDKLTELFKHFITAQKRSPLQFKKYYAVLSVAVQSEIAKRWDIPYKITDRPRTK